MTILSDKVIYVEVNDITAKFTSLKAYFCQERGKLARLRPVVQVRMMYTSADGHSWG